VPVLVISTHYTQHFRAGETDLAWPGGDAAHGQVCRLRVRGGLLTLGLDRTRDDAQGLAGQVNQAAGLLGELDHGFVPFALAMACRSLSRSGKGMVTANSVVLPSTR